MTTAELPDQGTLFARMAATGRVLGPEAAHTGTTRLRAEVVVVGTGAGGAACFRELALAGVDVLALEAGAWHIPPRDFTQREEDMMHRLYWNGGATAMRDMSVLVTHGRGVGGSTVHNINLSADTPAAILDRWTAEAGLVGWDAAAMAPVFARVRRTARVIPLSEGEVNRNNAIVRAGAEALGWQGRLYEHNRFACLQCGFCVQGCAYNRKQSALLTYIPAGVLAGGRLAWGCHVTRIRMASGRALGVDAIWADPETGRSYGNVRIDANAVVLAASGLLSPALLAASGIRDPHNIGGNVLRLHPAVPVAARFRDPVDAYKGLPQSYLVEEFATFLRGNGYGGYIIIPLSGHPGLTAALLPGSGPTLGRWLRAYRYLSIATPLLHDEGRGRVSVDSKGRLSYHYRLTPDDARWLADGIKRTAELYLAAGAEAVLLPYTRREVVVTKASDLKVVDERGVGPGELMLASVHPQGSLPMAADPRRGAIDGRGHHFGVRNLWVADASVFPSSVGVPPQLSVYAAGTKVARELLRARSASSAGANDDAQDPGSTPATP